jgi:hypothetical protein
VSEGELAGALTAALQVGFDLSREVPLRAHLFALGGDEHVCFWCCITSLGTAGRWVRWRGIYRWLWGAALWSCA